MTMTNEEIRRDWEGAKDKKAQIGILADLNLCKKDDIIKILKEAGVDPRRLPRKKQKTVCIADPLPDLAEATPATTPEPEKAEPYVKPRRLHDLDRLCELFHAIAYAISIDVPPKPEWLDEFDDIWLRLNCERVETKCFSNVKRS